jgi:glucose dehydrogenase
VLNHGFKRDAGCMLRSACNLVGDRVYFLISTEEFSMQIAKIVFCVSAALPALYGQSDWPAYGGNLANTRYSTLDQINTQNVTKLAQAWVNYNTGDIAWRVPFGRVDALEAKGVMNTGSFNKGGSVATAGGLLFIGASYDQRFHAYDSRTGKLLWEVKLAANAQANPITYAGKNGRQYVVVDSGDSILAYRLP